MKNKILILALLFTVGSVIAQDWVPSPGGNGFTSTDGQGIQVYSTSGGLVISDQYGNQTIVTPTSASSFYVSSDAYNQGGQYYSSWSADFGDPSGVVWITPTPAQALAFAASAGTDSSWSQSISPLLAQAGLSSFDPSPPAPTSLVDILSAKIGGTLITVSQVLASLLVLGFILISLFMSLKITRKAYEKIL